MDPESIEVRHNPLRAVEAMLVRHGLETNETLIKRNTIRTFFGESNNELEQILGTKYFSVMLGGSLQRGNADRNSDTDLTIIFDHGDIGKIWTAGGTGETSKGIRGLIFFNENSLRKRLDSEIDVNLLSVEELLKNIDNLMQNSAEELDIFILDDILRVFLPQIFGNDSTIDLFRKSIIAKLSTLPNGEKIWEEIRLLFRERIKNTDNKGGCWPEREERTSFDSQRKNKLSEVIVNILRNVELPTFQTLRDYYEVVTK